MFNFTLPYVYDFDRAIVRLAGDPVNSVDLQNRTIRIPMEEGNICHATKYRHETTTFIYSGKCN